MHHLFVIPVPFSDHYYELRDYLIIFILLHKIISLFLSYYIVITALFAHMKYLQELKFVQTNEQNKQ